jgi:hypothetical protein
MNALSIVNENDARQSAWLALGFTDPDDAEAALFAAGWQAGRDWARGEVNGDLLAALEAIVHSGGTIPDTTFEAALDAIAKARGEQP